ncbi:MAG: 23S rRNA (adenine(2030)-N(6))-methyltransferase RlmJ [Pseudomonadota bacterium]
MLSYRHSFHAGNFADVHKHLALSLIIQALCRKDAPFFYLDTHSGAGLYDLRGDAAQKTGEYHDGIERLWRSASAPSLLRPYLDAVIMANAGDVSGALRYYPGSPWLARHWLRAQDRMVLCELHGSEYPLLKQLFQGDRQAAVHHQDGYQGLKAFLPPKERRGAVLIDPAYELKDEFARVAEALIQAHQRWESGIYAVWYPILGHKPITGFYERIRASGIRKVLRTEFNVEEPAATPGMTGSGLLIVNPPWQLDEQLREGLAWVWPQLARRGQGGVVVDWLVPE